MGLSDGERISMMRSAVFVQVSEITRVTDERTDGIGVAYTRYSIMLSRVKYSWARTRGAQLSAGYTANTYRSTSGFPNALVFCSSSSRKTARFVENQRVGKTRRRSIYSADRQTRDRHDLPPAKVTVPS